MRWLIEGDGREVHQSGDRIAWQWRLRNGTSGESRAVLVSLTGTTMSMGEDALTGRGLLARGSRGRSEVEMLLDWPEPPNHVEVHSRGVQLLGGDPGPELRELHEIVNWFDERGALLVFAMYGSDDPTSPTTRPTVHVLLKDSGELLYEAAGASQLDAARGAQQKWDGKGKVVEGSGKLVIRTSISATGVAIGGTAAKKAEEAASAYQGDAFTVKIEILGGEPGSMLVLEVRDSDGNPLDVLVGEGTDVDDLLLEAVLTMLAKWKGGPM